MLVADEIIVDLEDSVPAGQKADARAAVAEALAGGLWASRHGQRAGQRDLDALVRAGPAGARRRRRPARLGDRPEGRERPTISSGPTRLLAAAERERPIGLQALIESARGLRDVNAIAEASPLLEALILGPADMSVSLGFPSPDEGARWDFVRGAVLVAARAAGLQAIDGPYLRIGDDEGLRESAARARELGFDGKWALHPDQIEPLNELFAPTAEEAERARAILAALGELERRGGDARRGDDRRGQPQARRGAAGAGAGRGGSRWLTRCRWVQEFSEGSRDQRELLGGKGAGVAEMTRVLGAERVPAGFTITTEACVAYMQNGRRPPDGLDAEVDEALAALERRTGKVLGDGEAPLLVSVRSGARVSMPGMLDTVLNLGLNDESVAGLARSTGDERFAWDSYRRFVQMFGNVVRGVPGSSFEQALGAGQACRRGRSRHRARRESAPRAHRMLSRAVQRADRRGRSRSTRASSFAQAIVAVFDSWDGERAVAYRRINGIPDDWGTAVNVQQMVFGNRGDGSGLGSRVQPRRAHRRADALGRLPTQRPG